MLHPQQVHMADGRVLVFMATITASTTITALDRTSGSVGGHSVIKITGTGAEGVVHGSARRGAPGVQLGAAAAPFNCCLRS